MPYKVRVMKSEFFVKVGNLRVEAALARMNGEIEKAIILEVERQEIFNDPNSYREVEYHV